MFEPAESHVHCPQQRYGRATRASSDGGARCPLSPSTASDRGQGLGFKVALAKYTHASSPSFVPGIH